MPQIHFCKSSDGLRIAFAQDGRGPAMIEVAKRLNHVEYDCLNRMVRSPSQARRNYDQVCIGGANL
jgi:hypothetical protein